MEVEYEITRDDLYAFQWRAAFRSGTARRARRAVYLGWALAIVVYAFLPAIGPHGITLSEVSPRFILTALVIVFLLQWTLDRWLVRRAIRHILRDERPDRGQLGRHRLTLSDEGLTESTAVGESRTSWAGVDRVEQNQDYIYIYTSPAAAHVIPKRAFSSRDQAEAFYQLSEARRHAAG